MQPASPFPSAQARRRYQFVLTRVVFCKVTFTPAEGPVQILFFYRDGGALEQHVTDPALQGLQLVVEDIADYNLRFWEIRELVRSLRQADARYAFESDHSLQRLLGY